MRRYKTVVTDYEGMQGVLDSHAESGWALLSLTPDTWRRTFAEDSGMEHSPFEELDSKTSPMREYSASYYLLVFQRDENLDMRESYATAEKSLPFGQLPNFDE